MAKGYQKSKQIGEKIWGPGSNGVFPTCGVQRNCSKTYMLEVNLTFTALQMY